EKLAKQLILRESEAIGFGETYSDLIAYVLRWVETMSFGKALGKASRKEVQESFQASDYLTRVLTKTTAESLAWGDVIRKGGVKRLAESLPISELPQRGVTKNSYEAFGLSDDLDRQMTKRISEAVAFAETYTDLIAFILRISESLGVSDLGAKQVRKPFSEAFGTTDKAARQTRALRFLMRCAKR
ncbi:MAG: hypothetical protein EBU75_05915, partial [Betaproteobacteria bacterium]|nr:hypothetical protein [Betaproteobacteria bacterium]